MSDNRNHTLQQRKKKALCNSVLIRSNKMQQYAGVYLLQNHSTCFGCPSYPSSGLHKTITAASGTGHSNSATTFLQRGLIRPRWRKVVAQLLWPVPEAAVTVLYTPDDGCDGHPKHVEGDFAVNKHLRTVASCWILLIYSYDARNHEYKIHNYRDFRLTKHNY